jgi:hypothetical protein
MNSFWTILATIMAVLLVVAIANSGEIVKVRPIVDSRVQDWCYIVYQPAEGDKYVIAGEPNAAMHYWGPCSRDMKQHFESYHGPRFDGGTSIPESADKGK